MRSLSPSLQFTLLHAPDHCVGPLTEHNQCVFRYTICVGSGLEGSRSSAMRDHPENHRTRQPRILHRDRGHRGEVANGRFIVGIEFLTRRSVRMAWVDQLQYAQNLPGRSDQGRRENGFRVVAILLVEVVVECVWRLLIQLVGIAYLRHFTGLRHPSDDALAIDANPDAGSSQILREITILKRPVLGMCHPQLVAIDEIARAGIGDEYAASFGQQSLHQNVDVLDSGEFVREHGDRSKTASLFADIRLEGYVHGLERSIRLIERDGLLLESGSHQSKLLLGDGLGGECPDPGDEFESIGHLDQKVARPFSKASTFRCTSDSLLRMMIGMSRVDSSD